MLRPYVQANQFESSGRVSYQSEGLIETRSSRACQSSFDLRLALSSAGLPHNLTKAH